MTETNEVADGMNVPPEELAKIVDFHTAAAFVRTQMPDETPQVTDGVAEGLWARIASVRSRIKDGQFTMSDCVWCFAVPGANSIIDVLHPLTGRTLHYGHTLEDVRSGKDRHEAEPNAIKMLVDDHCKAKAARQDSPIEWEPISEERYNEWFECLPPAGYGHQAFLVGEPSDHHAGNGQPRFQACRKRDGKFEASTRPLTRAEFKKL